MKRTKVTSVGNNDKHLKPCKKSKPGGISCDDETVSDVGQKQIESSPTVGQSDSCSRGKRMLVKRDKGIELKSRVITCARKKGRPAGNSRGDLMKKTSGKIVEKESVVVLKGKEWPPAVTCVMGLQCKAITDLQAPNRKVKSVMEAETSLRLAPNLVPHEGKEADSGTIQKRKRGRPPNKSKTPLSVVAVSHENGDAVVKEKKSAEKVSLSSTNTNSGKATITYKSVKGKRGKRRKIRSINIVSPLEQGGEEKEKEKEKGVMEKEYSIVAVEKSADTISDDQPLSVWFESKKQTETSAKLSFEKRSTLWATLESMELFQVVPQNPHFGPLEKEKEGTREGKAISKMVTYVRVVEATSQLQLHSPRTMYEENLEALAELEAYGFDVKALTERLTRLLLVKEEEERLEREAEKVRVRMEAERREVERIDKEIEMVDKQVVALLEKRAHVLKNKENKDAEVGLLEAQVAAILQGMSDLTSTFHHLAAAHLSVSPQQG